MNVSDFDFELPESLIAQEARPRGASRLMIVDRATRSFRESTISELPNLLSPGDLIVVNDTRVFPARLLGRRVPSGGRVECLLLERVSDTEWHALVHPGQKLKIGARMAFDDPIRAPGVVIEGEILAREFFGRRLVRFRAFGAASFDAAVDAVGHVPLPPYIDRPDRPDDNARYQTVFASARGSIAAPTAGIHFDDATLSALKGRGVGWATVTLHVGYGTFKPVRSETVEEHRVDPEPYVVSASAADAIRANRSQGGRVVAVGTTTTRALESAALRTGFRCQAIDALLTNFHLPQSSLLMLVAAFAGRDLTLAAYRHAVEARFRFYSYGDAMLIL